MIPYTDIRSIPIPFSPRILRSRYSLFIQCIYDIISIGFYKEWSEPN